MKSFVSTCMVYDRQLSFAADIQMSDINAGGMLSAREVLTTLLSCFSCSTTNLDTCNGSVIKDMLVHTIAVYNITYLAYNSYYTMSK